MLLLREEEQSALRAMSTDFGFDLAGFASLELTPRQKEGYRSFVAEGRHGTMDWFEKHLDMRLQPALLLPGAKSAMVLASRYGDERYEALARESNVLVSRYAVGRDYHRLLRRRGAALLRRASELLPDLAGRVVVDSAPVPEKALAAAAGIAWQGKHTNMIHPRLGSYFFLVVILLKAEVVPDAPMPDRCGQCRLCVDACPTGALEPYRLDARRCISYLTIETTGAIPAALEAKLSGWVFGCDICQEVCPYNKAVDTIPERSGGAEEFRIRTEVAQLMRTGVLAGAGAWTELAGGSAIGRAGEDRLRRTIAAVRKKGSHVREKGV